MRPFMALTSSAYTVRGCFFVIAHMKIVYYAYKIKKLQSILCFALTAMLSITMGGNFIEIALEGWLDEATALFRKVEPHDTMGKSLIPTLFVLGSTGYSRLF